MLPGGRSSAAVAINDRGQIVGSTDTGRSTDAIRPFLWQNGQLRDLGSLGGSARAVAINNHGQIVGWSLRAGEIARPLDSGEMWYSHAVLWTLRSG
jgi:probable HAF family extracellular repeat protein